MSMQTEPLPRARPLVGIGLVCITVFFFAVSDVIGKHLAMLYPVPVVMAARYIFSLLLLLGLMGPRLGRRLWRVNRFWLVLLRGSVLAVASLTMGHALRLMPVGETIAIMYLSPFAVMMLAIPLFGEKVSPAGWFLAILGFSGVLLILRPGGNLDPLGMVFALLNASCATVFHLMTRALSRTESAIAMLFYVTLIGAGFFAISAVPYLDGLAIERTDFLLMLAFGGTATLGHFLFAAAYREAPASLIAPVNYLHLVWAGLLGWAVFGHVPDAITMAGMGLVIFAGVAIALRAHFAR